LGSLKQALSKSSSSIMKILSRPGGISTPKSSACLTSSAVLKLSSHERENWPLDVLSIFFYIVKKKMI